jgi:lipid-A-disaccharide synthase
MAPDALSASSGGSIALVAGEASGDNLGGALIRELGARTNGQRFVGVAGPRMLETGCEAWYPSEALAVMGLAEVIRHLPRLLRLRRDLLKRLIAEQPRVFVGIDAPEFNLRVARKVKQAGIPSVQYVSPQVWAWRQGRVKSIGRSVDLILCIFPFETAFYENHAVRAVFVGHPLADRIPMVSDARQARTALGLPAEGPLLAVLPGSRSGEVSRLSPPFAATIAWLKERRPELAFVAPMANPGVREVFEASLAEHAPGVTVRLLDGAAELALAASDAVLVTSGTATLEAALVKRPMVVAYRVAPLTGWLLRRMKLVKTDYFSQPNLLAGRELVPEFFQEQVRAEVLGPAILGQLDRPDREQLRAAFEQIHLALRCDASARAAEAILALMASRGAT